MQKTQWRSRTSCWKNWWLDDSRSQCSWWQLRISKLSSICSRGAGLGHPMDPVASVQNRNFSGNTKAKPVKIFPGKSLYVDTTQIGNKWDCGESSAQSERRYLCSVVAIRSGWKLVGRFSGMLYLSAKHSRSLVWWENSIRETFWKPFKGPIIGSLVEYCPISAKDQSRIHQFGKKVLPGLFFGYALYPGRIWKGDILVADLEELETMDASEIYSKRLNAKEVIFPKRKWKIHFSSRRWTNKICWMRSGPENIHLGTGTPNSRRKSRWFSWRTRRVSSTTSRLISGCRWSDEWFLVHVRKLHIPPSRWTQSQTLLAERRIIPYSTEIYFDASRTTRTNLDVMQERHIDDYWNIDGSRDLSDSWTGFTQFTLLSEKPPDGYMWSGWRDHLWLELWRG